MKKLITGLFAISFIAATTSSCQKCMTCTIDYTLTTGKEMSETTPQHCGTSGDLDDKEAQLEDAYSVYEDVEVTCDRN